MSAVFDFQDIHLRALLKILNFVNNEFLTTSASSAATARTRQPSRGPTKGKLAAKAAAAVAANTCTQLHANDTIESIDIHNRQLIIDSILNCIQYFDQQFKYNYKFVVYKTDDKITRIEKWLQHYYSKELLNDIDFEIVTKQVLPDVELKPPLVLCNHNNNDNIDINVNIAESSVHMDNNDTNNGDNSDQQMLSETVVQQSSQQPELSPLDTKVLLATLPESQPPDQIHNDLLLDVPSLSSPLPPTEDAIETNPIADQSNEINVQIDDELVSKLVYNLELILLLVVIVLYKVRNLFPKLLDYLEFAWIYLSQFETRLEPHVRIENMIELLQNEFTSQRNANRMRTEVLSNEIIQLNAMIDNLDKQYEEETKELIYLQNATIIGHNNTSANSRQLSKLMNIKGGGREAKLYACPECGKNFKNGYKLNRHRYVHKDPSEKPYMCDWPGCGYRSIANNDLNRHRMIHTGEKPFQCDVEGCERKYSRPDKLSHHKRVAHNKDPINKPFACDWPGCGYRSLANADLLRHQYIHTGERPFKCDFDGCDKAFSRPDKLRNHKDKSRHNLDELMSLDGITAPDTDIPTADTDSQRVATALSIADCVPQAIQWQ